MYVVGAVGGVFLSCCFGVLVESLYSVCLEAGTGAGGALAWPTSFKGSGAYALALTALLPAFAYYLRSIDEELDYTLRYAYWNADLGRLFLSFVLFWLLL